MMSLAELDLPYLAMEKPEFAENPFPHFAAARQQQADRSLGLEPDPALRSAIDASLADDLAIGEELSGFEGAEAPFEQLAGFLGTVAGSLQPVHHHDQPLPPLHRRTDQAIARFLREPGFKSVGPGHGTEKRIAVLLTDLVPSIIRLAENRIEIRISANDVTRQQTEFTCRNLFRGVR